MIYIILALIVAIIKLWWDLRGLDARLKIHESLIDMAVVDIEKMIELDKLTTKMAVHKDPYAGIKGIRGEITVSSYDDLKNLPGDAILKKGAVIKKRSPGRPKGSLKKF